MKSEMAEASSASCRVQGYVADMQQHKAHVVIHGRLP